MSTPDPDEPSTAVVDDALQVLRTDLPEPSVAPADAPPEQDVEEVPIPDELTFTTEAKTPDSVSSSDVLELRLDEDVLYARKPSKGAWSLIIGAVSRSANEADKTQALLEFVYASFDQASLVLIKNRMFDPNDSFDVDDLARMVDALVRKWAPSSSRAERRKAMRAVPAR